MKINITYHDDSALTVEEVVKQAEHNYGRNAIVEVTAHSSAPHDQIYFAIQQIITARQLALIYDNKYTYQKDIANLRSDVLAKLIDILDSVIIDNEARVA